MMQNYRNINWRSEKTLTDRIFVLCVIFLLWGGEKLNLTYNQVNVIFFVIIWPIFTLILIGNSLYCFLNH